MSAMTKHYLYRNEVLEHNNYYCKSKRDCMIISAVVYLSDPFLYHRYLAPLNVQHNSQQICLLIIINTAMIEQVRYRIISTDFP